MDNIQPIAFTINSFNDENIQIELGDEVEFNVKNISGHLIAENIIKVPLTINNSYVNLFFNRNLFFFLILLVNTSNYLSWSCCITCSNDNK